MYFTRVLSGSVILVSFTIVTFQVESGIGSNTIPLLLLESRFNCDVRDWSGPRMSAIGSMNLEIAYYNSKLALWEPVLEPIVSVQPDGTSIKKRWDLIISMQKNAASDFGSAFVSPRFASPSLDLFRLLNWICVLAVDFPRPFIKKCKM